ncbi:MAG: DUF4172 domain-containing protein [Boseongicola sp.]|nr:DUF4172 domain-containing protein [Boseongicola sp.]
MILVDPRGISRRCSGCGAESDRPKTLAANLVAVRHRQGRLLGRMEGLGFGLRNEAMLRTLTQDVVKSSEIEGETLGDYIPK